MDFSCPCVCAIVNCTPDSFYGGSRNPACEAAVRAALAAEEAGAAVVDFGAESTRPEAAFVPPETELARLIPVIRAFRAVSKLPVSVDTRRAAVARAALDEGADIINDVSALRDDPEMAALCAKTGAALVLTHRRPFDSPSCGAAIAGEVRGFLREALQKALNAGVTGEKIILDPGIGFGKDTGENLILLNHLAETAPADYPVLVGLSRKRFIGEICGRAVEDRLAGTIAAAYAALCAGADILRIHDTAAAVDAAAIFTALRENARQFG